MIYHYEVPVIRGEYIKTYLAEITGEDPKYLLKRRFLQRSFKECGGVRTYRYDIGGHGVFEQSIKRFHRRTDELISRERKWFIYYRRRFYYIDCSEALFCAYNLKAQYWRWTPLTKAEEYYGGTIMYTTTIQKCGDEYFIPLPQEVIDCLGLKEGDSLDTQLEGEGVIILKGVIINEDS